ncbi:ofd1 [Symbiodinium sp. CCMP2592]|nr:ofd1 [Symbiodinium sp. CCMP2592]
MDSLESATDLQRQREAAAWTEKLNGKRSTARRRFSATKARLIQLDGVQEQQRSSSKKEPLRSFSRSKSRSSLPSKSQNVAAVLQQKQRALDAQKEIARMKLLSLHHSAARRRALQARSPMSDSDDGESTPQEQRQSIMGLAAADSADVATVRSSFRGGDRISSRPSIPSTAPVLDDELEDEELRKEFESGQPFPHVVLRPFLGEAGLRAVREELEKVDATEKETDLFRFFQTEDFAARLSQAATEESSPKKRRIERKTSALQSIARLFGSQDYRSLIQEITGCGELSERVDLATQVYTKGSHLLCHDDVIGTRKVSFIYYMTDPEEDWSKEEGGALELFPSNPAQKGTPASIPSKELLPMSDSLAIFLVEPGVSFHAVREVRGDRARVSLQGWLHAPSLEQTRNFGQRDLATLQQILDTRAGAGKVGPQEVEEPLPDLGELTEEDWKLLSKWLAPSYCDPKQLQAVPLAPFASSLLAAVKTYLPSML